MKFLTALLSEIFGAEQAGGETIALTIYMLSPTNCREICRYSTAGGSSTTVVFAPPMPLEEALLHVRKFQDKGRFVYGKETS